MQPALLLLGPTGAGKTPLGEMLQQRGLNGRRCLHFDFGANLREIVDRNEPNEQITAADIRFVRDVLQSGALLEDEQFPLAAGILQSFLTVQRADADTIVVLNGLPRHVGQAMALERCVSLRAVIVLNCEPEVVLARIDSNIGGDRAGRADDSLDDVRAKLAIYEARTKPLIDHYRAAGVQIIALSIAPETTAEEAWQQIDTAL